MIRDGRKRELALRRLCGASRRQVLRVVTGESLLLALAGVVLAAGVSALLLAGLDTAFSGLGTNVLPMPPLRATTANNPAVIHSARFIIHSLIEDCLCPVDEMAIPPVTSREHPGV